MSQWKFFFVLASFKLTVGNIKKIISAPAPELEYLVPSEWDSTR